MYRGYEIYQNIDKAAQVLDNLDRTFEFLRSLQVRHSQVFAFRVDLRFPLDFETPERYADNQTVIDLQTYLRSEIKALTGKAEPEVYVLWARELNDQSLRRNATDADLRDGEADLTKPHYHLLVAVNRDDFRKLGALERSEDGHYSDLTLAHMVIRSWQRVLQRPSHRMRGIAHFAEHPKSDTIRTFTIRRLDGPEGLIDVLKAASYLCKAYSKDTGKRLRTFQTGRIPAEIREAIWRQERHRQEPVRAAECYRAENAGGTTRFALEDVDVVRYWLLQPALQYLTSDMAQWQRFPTEELFDLHHTWEAERQVKRIVRCESAAALERLLVRYVQRGTPTGQAALILKLLEPARCFLEVSSRETALHPLDGTRRVYDRSVTHYRQAFEALARELQERYELSLGALKHRTDLPALYEDVVDRFYRLRGELARTDIREQAGQERRAFEALAVHYAAEIDRLLTDVEGLQVVMLQLGHDPRQFPRLGDLTLADSQQAFSALLEDREDSPLFTDLKGLVWKRDHTLVRQHGIHLIALYGNQDLSVDQRRDGIAAHWLHRITRGQGAAYRVLPTTYNTEHLLTPDLSWITAGDTDRLQALARQLRGLFGMDQLTALRHPPETAGHGFLRLQPQAEHSSGR
ncbi:MAG: YagK/YfjJ domain-containing protein [Pseudomonadota bacterium]